jgi:hypothetical protein
MSQPAITRSVIESYLHDALPPEQAATVEKAIREQPSLLALVSQVRRESDFGEHSVGAIWKRERLSCPTREKLAMLLDDVLDDDYAEYVKSHIKVVGCHVCQSVLDDLHHLRAEPTAPRAARRKRIADSSAGILRDISRRS